MKETEKNPFGYNRDSYYDGPYKDLGLTPDEIEIELRKAEENAKKYKDWSEVDC